MKKNVYLCKLEFGNLLIVNINRIKLTLWHLKDK